MKKTILFLLLLQFSIRPQQKSADYSEAVRFLSDTIKVMMNEQRIPGLAAAIVTNKEVLWLHCAGVRDTIMNQPVDENTLFSVQSISKNITAAVVLAAVQEGLLNLNVPITRYIPDFKVNSIYEENAEDKITLRILLSHRAGFTHEAPIGSNYTEGTFDEHIRSISDTWLRFPVNQRFSYSNLGIDLAGYIVQEVSGKPFYKYAEEKLLQHIGIKDAAFDFNKVISGNHASGSYSGWNNTPLQIPMIPSGGYFSSIKELAKYLQFLMNRGRCGEKQVLEDSLISQMVTIQFKRKNQTHGYGLGLAVRMNKGKVFLGHNGSGFGFISNMLWYPDQNIGVILLTNSNTHDLQNSLPDMILEKFISNDYWLNSSKKDSVLTNLIDPENKSLFAGQYLYNRNGYMNIEKAGDKIGFGTGENFRELHFTADDEAYDVINGEIFNYKFISQKGKPAYIIREYDGEHLDYNTFPEDTSAGYNNEWDKYIGRYQMIRYGEEIGYIEVKKSKGYLWLSYIRLNEYEPGLFFTPHGQALDFRSTTPTWRNIRLNKQSED